LGRHTRLEQLWLSACGSEGLAHLAPSLGGLAPALRELRLSATSLPPWLPQLAALTCLRAPAAGLGSAADMRALAALHGLQELEFGLWRLAADAPSSALCARVTSLTCRLGAWPDVLGLQAAFPGVARAAIVCAAFEPLPVPAAHRWSGLRDLDLSSRGYMVSPFSYGLLDLLSCGDGGLTRLCVSGGAPSGAELAAVLRLAPALKDLTATAPIDGDLEELFEALRLEPPPAAPAGLAAPPPPPPPGQQLSRLLLAPVAEKNVRGITVAGLLAMGRALPNLRTLVILFSGPGMLQLCAAAAGAGRGGPRRPAAGGGAGARRPPRVHVPAARRARRAGAVGRGAGRLRCRRRHASPAPTTPLAAAHGDGGGD
jgi:hypothetical protein